MELERISVALRPRTSREAVDLGAVLLRAYARPVWLAWFACTLPFVMICMLAGWITGKPWLGLFLLWWCKPVYDRVPLYVLSRAVFEQPPAWRDTLHGVWQWGGRGVLSSLCFFWSRPGRGLRLPQILLEGQPAAQRAMRWKILSGPVSATMVGLTLGCLIFELVLFFSVFLFVFAFVPAGFLPDFFHASRSAWSHMPMLFSMMVMAAAYAVISVIEPFYVAAGFGVYLTRRTQLEAWDIDLAFRCLRRRWETAGRALLLCLCMSLSVCALGWSGQSRAAEASPAPGASTPSVRIEQVFHQPASEEDQRFSAAVQWAYGDPRLGGKGMRHEWVLRHPPRPMPPETPKPLHMSPALVHLMKIIGGLIGIGIKFVLLGFLLVALIVLARFVMRQGWRIRLPGRKPRAEIPLAAMHDEPAMDTLPEDLSAAVQRLWQGGRQREALAMLYRGCVAQVADALGAPAPIDATEADCLHQSQRLPDALHRQRAMEIVRAWQYAAYAGRFPSDSDVDALLTGWPAQRAGAA